MVNVAEKKEHYNYLKPFRYYDSDLRPKKNLRQSSNE
jgi:hypothetical protein